MHILQVLHGTSTPLLAFHAAQETHKALLTLARVSTTRTMKLNPKTYRTIWFSVISGNVGIDFSDLLQQDKG